MSENLTTNTNVELNSSANGTVSFASDVIATIAGLAATEVDGVAAMIATNNLGLVDMLRKNQNNRQLTKGVRVELNQNTVVLHLTVNIEYGSPVPDVAREVQDNVKKAVETMTGLDVDEVNIYIQGVSFEKANQAALEQEEMRQTTLEQTAQARLSREAGQTADEAINELPKLSEGVLPDDYDLLFDDIHAAEPAATEPEIPAAAVEPEDKPARKTRRKPE